MIFNIFNSLFVFAAIKAHSIETYHSNFVNNHDKFDTQELLRIVDDYESRRFKIRFNLPSRNF